MFVSIFFCGFIMRMGACTTRIRTFFAMASIRFLLSYLCGC